FQVVYASSGFADNKTYGVRFLHGAASVKPAGNSCAGSIDTINVGDMPPHAGCEAFAIRMQGGRPSAMTVLVAGVAPAVMPLPFGGPGCTVLIDPAQTLVTLEQGVSQPSGTYIVPLPIPSRTVAIGLLWQFVQLDLGRLWSSGALRTDIR